MVRRMTRGSAGSGPPGLPNFRRLVGWWSLIRYEVAVGTRPFLPLLGIRPEGVLYLGDHGWMSVVINSDPALADDSLALAYAGPYRIRSRDLSIHVASASIPAWRGTEQRRRISWNGRHLVLTSTQQASSFAPSEPSRGRAVWRRILTETREQQRFGARTSARVIGSRLA